MVIYVYHGTLRLSFLKDCCICYQEISIFVTLLNIANENEFLKIINQTSWG